MHSGLKRSRTDVILGGVAGGIAKSLNLDPVIPRLIFVILALAGGGGLLIYIILWIAVPQEDYVYNAFQNQGNPPETQEQADQQQEIPPFAYEKPRYTGNLLAGVILIAIGLIFLIQKFVDWIDLSHLWPILLIIAGGVLLLNAFIKRS